MSRALFLYNRDMTGKTHQVIGITAGLGVYLATTSPEYSPATLGAVLVLSHFMALLPDIDQPTSRIWQTVPLFGRVAGEMVDPFLKHRNITHSILGAGIIFWLLLNLVNAMPTYWGIDSSAVLLAGMVAYASHLLADMVTVDGIRVTILETSFIIEDGMSYTKGSYLVDEILKG